MQSTHHYSPALSRQALSVTETIKAMIKACRLKQFILSPDKGCYNRER